jgi:hypothetical protein
MQRSLLAAQFDAALELKDAGSAITANGVGQVGGVNRVVNVGAAFLRATLIVDVDAFTAGAAASKITLQGSTVADFSADVVNLADVDLGTAATIAESADRGVGRVTTTFMNSRNGQKAYPFLRVSHAVPNGSVNYRAFITKDILAG